MPEISPLSEKRLRSAFLGNDFGEAGRMIYGGIVPVENPEGFLRSSAAAAWASNAMGRRITHASADWQGVKDGIVKGYFRNPNAAQVSDDEVFNLIAEDYRTRDKVKETAFNAAARGQSITEAAAEFNKGAEGSPVGRSWYKYQTALQARYYEDSAALAPFQETIQSVSKGVKAAMNQEVKEDNAGRFDFAPAVRQMLSVPEENRPLVLEALAAQMPEDDSGLNPAARLARFFERGMEQLITEGSTGSMEMVGVPLMDALIPSNEIPMGEEESADAKAMDDERKQMNLLRVQLRNIGQGIAPIEDVRALGMNFGGAAQSLPMTLSSLVPYVGVPLMVGQFRQEGIATTMAENPGMKLEDAEMLNTIAAPFKAIQEVFTDRLIFGRMPAFERFLNSPILTPSGMAGRIGMRVGVGIPVEQLDENSQKLTSLLIQDAAVALGADISGVNWDDRLEEFKSMQGEVLATSLPIILLGGGVGTINDYRTGRHLVKNRNALIMSGISPELADPIIADATKGDLKAAEGKLRTGADTATLEQRQEAAKAFMQQSQKQAQAVEQMEVNGTLASVRPTAKGWQVRNDQGLQADFPTFEEADAARWADAKQRNLRVHSVYREIISGVERNLKEGQENVITFSPEEMTPELAVDRGIATPEKVSRRKAQSQALDEGKLETQTFEQASAEAEAAGDNTPVHLILGSNALEYADGVSRGVIRLFRGATPHDLIEEFAEIGVKRATTPEARRSLLASLRDAEAKMQSPLFTGQDDAQVTDSDIIEAFSHLAKSYYSNEATGKNTQRYLQTLRAAVVGSDAFKWVQALGAKLGNVLRRAAMIQQVKEGQGFTPELERLIRQAVGLEGQDVFEVGVMTEAKAMAKEAGPDFSLSRKTTGTLEERLSAMFDPFQKSPEMRRQIGLVAKNRVAKVAREYLANVSTPGMQKRKMEEMEKDRIKALGKIKDTTPEWIKKRLETPTTDAQVKAEIAQDRLLGWLRALNAAVSTLPAEVRGKIIAGGSVKIASLKTNEARLRAVDEIVKKADAELEKWLKKELGESIAKLLERAQPEGGPGEVKKSKLIVSVQDEVDEITRIISLDPETVEREIEAANAGVIAASTDTAAVDSLTRLHLLDTFGGLFDKATTAEEMSAAHDYLQTILKQGREARQILDEARRSEVRAMVEQAKKDANKGGATTADVQRGRRQGKGKGVDTLKNMAREMFSHRGVLLAAFGESNKTADSFDERFIKGTDAYEDAKADRRRRLTEFCRALYSTKSERAFGKKIAKLETPVDKTGVTIGAGRKTETDTQTLDAARRIVENPKAFGYTSEEAALFEAELEGNIFLPAKYQKTTVTIERVIEQGTREELNLTQMEAVYISMSLRQPGILEQQGKWGYDIATVDQLEAFLSDDAKQWRDFLQSEYDAEYAKANEVYMRLFHARMPHIRFYSPLFKNHQGNQTPLDPLAFSLTAQSFNPGSLKLRKTNTSSLRIESALAVYQAHFEQMDYWVHMAEYLRDVQGVMLNPEVRSAVVAAHGEGAMTALSAWVTLEMSRGVTKGVLALQATKWLKNVRTGIIYKALAFNLGTAMKATNSVLYGLTQIPMQRWPAALADGFTHWGALWRSGTIQRRVDFGGTPELREIAEQNGRSPSWLRSILVKGSYPTQLWDAVMTSYSGAMAYGHALEEAKRAGASDEAASRYAEERAQIAVARSAQPATWAGRSLIEQENAIGALFFMFSSDPRQKLGIVGEAVMQWKRGNASNEELARKVIAGWVLPGVIFQLAGAAARSIFKGDDDEWEISDFVRAGVVGPLQGFFLFGSAVEMLAASLVAKSAEMLTGDAPSKKPFWSSGANPITDIAPDIMRGLGKMSDAAENDDYMEAAWELAKAGGMFATPFTPSGALPSVADRVFKDTSTMLFQEE